jgi:predicted dienelactone hydrolase
LANLVTFFILSVPRLREIHWLGYAAPITLLIAGIQVLAEGPRWQLIPAYALAIIFFLIWLPGIVLPGIGPASRLVSTVGTAAGALLLAISIALPVLLPVFHFPKPSGPYAIGTLTYHWVDTSRPELFTPDPNDHRELMAQVWYPAQGEPAAPRAAYIQDAGAVTPALAGLLHVPSFFLSHLKYVTTHAVPAAPIADARASYPVLIYLTGLGGFRSASTFQIEALVSHGYVVVGLDQPGGAAMVRYPDGRQIPGWTKPEINALVLQSIAPQTPAPALDGVPLPEGIAPYFAQDASFALDQLALLNQSDPHHILTGHLDLAHAGTFGISLGGMNAAEACYRDPRFKACLIMDVYIPADAVKGGLKQPAMLITRDAETMRLERERSGGWTEKEIALTLDTMRQVYADLPGDGYYLSIPTMFHINFTDAPAWSPITSQVGLTGPIDGQRGFDIVNTYTLAFFDQELEGRASPLLDGPSRLYPEVSFEKR